MAYRGASSASARPGTWHTSSVDGATANHRLIDHGADLGRVQVVAVEDFADLGNTAGSNHDQHPLL